MFVFISDLTWLLLGNIFPIFADCGLVVEIQIHLTAFFLHPKPNVNQAKGKQQIECVIKKNVIGRPLKRKDLRSQCSSNDGVPQCKCGPLLMSAKWLGGDMFAGPPKAVWMLPDFHELLGLVICSMARVSLLVGLVMAVVGKHFPHFAYCGLVVEIQIHLTAKIWKSLLPFQPQPSGRTKRQGVSGAKIRSHGWNWPGVGLIMAYDSGMLKMLKAAISGKGWRIFFWIFFWAKRVPAGEPLPSRTLYSLPSDSRHSFPLLAVA